MVKTRKLNPVIGAEMTGIDLAGPIGDNLYNEIIQAWNDANGVLILRDQNITPEQHIAFSARFGELEKLEGHTVAKYLLPGHPEIYRVSNKVIDGMPQGRKGAGTYWHSDMSYSRTPPTASLLHAIEVPPYGGDTIFACMYAAYDALSEPMKGFLGSLQAVHDFAVASKTGFRNEVITAGNLSVTPQQTHPVVRTHPDTGRKALFVNEGFTSHIQGMTRAESDAVLGFLFRHSTQPEFLYRHSYRENDLVIWDNRCAMHYAVMDYDGVHDRYMHRCTVIGGPTA